MLTEEENCKMCTMIFKNVAIFFNRKGGDTILRLLLIWRKNIGFVGGGGVGWGG